MKNVTIFVGKLDSLLRLVTSNLLGLLFSPPRVMEILVINMRYF